MRDKLKLLAINTSRCYLFLCHNSGLNNLKKHITPTIKIAYTNGVKSILSTPIVKERNSESIIKKPNNANIMSSKIKFILIYFYWNIIKKYHFYKENSKWLMI